MSKNQLKYIVKSSWNHWHSPHTYHFTDSKEAKRTYEDFVDNGYDLVMLLRVEDIHSEYENHKEEGITMGRYVGMRREKIKGKLYNFTEMINRMDIHDECRTVGGSSHGEILYMDCQGFLKWKHDDSMVLISPYTKICMYEFEFEENHEEVEIGEEA